MSKALDSLFFSSVARTLLPSFFAGGIIIIALVSLLSTFLSVDFGLLWCSFVSQDWPWFSAALQSGYSCQIAGDILIVGWKIYEDSSHIMMNNGGFDLWYQVRRFADLDPVNIDGPVFRLHYWVTSTTIFTASAIAFAKQYFGDPIECIFVSVLEWIFRALAFCSFLSFLLNFFGTFSKFHCTQ